jgi:Cu-Zn family superoxide dismutase
MFSTLLLAATAALTLTLAHARSEKPSVARADLESKSGSQVKGLVEFLEEEEGVKVRYRITGLEKGKKYGFHVHETGDCSAPDAKSAGPHYKQIAKKGGTAKDSPGKHAGDLPEIKSDANGVAEGEVHSDLLSVFGKNAVDGRAIIVHGGPDNPKKKSPPRIACGVIKNTSERM